MRIMSCNLRYSRADDGPNRWELRKGTCLDVIRSRDPDIVCTQEMTDEQYQYLSSKLSDYTWAGATDQPGGRDPVNSIFFRSKKFSAVSMGAYWLSRTPHVPGTKSWGSRCVRLVNWIVLAPIDGSGDFRLINTHLDHVSQWARSRQARMIARDAAQYPPSYPQILTGDLNCDRSNQAVKRLLRAGFVDTYAAVHGDKDPGYTMHAFQAERYKSKIGKMDWIMVKGDATVTGAEVVLDSFEGRYPSDHYFVTADISLLKEES